MFHFGYRTFSKVSAIPIPFPPVRGPVKPKHIFIPLGLILVALTFGQSRSLNVQVDQVQDPASKSVTLWVTNGEFTPVTLTLSGEVTGYKGPSLPLSISIPSGKRLAAAIFKTDPEARRMRLSLQTSIVAGDLSAVPETNYLWQFPWKHGGRHRIDQGYNGNFSHQRMNALDFDLKEGEPILSAREGRVVRVRSNETRGGLDPSLSDKANGVDVLHRDGTLATYGHMTFHGTSVTQGAYVKAGDLLGHCGFTGYAQGAHLHFAVSYATAQGQKTLVTRFRGPDGEALFPAEGVWFTAAHEGKALTNRRTPADLTAADFAGHRVQVKTNDTIDSRQEQREDRFVVFLINGYSRDMNLTIIPETRNLAAVTPVPEKMLIPANTEVFWGIYKILKPDAPAGIGFRFTSTR